MIPSDNIVKFIKGFEQCKLKAYLPTPNDKPTIGWGSTGPDVKLGMTWTQTQADERFKQDLDRFAQGVSDLIKQGTQDEFDAMTSLAYNIGLQAFKASSVLRLHNIGDHEGAADAFLLWNKQAGHVLDGLTTRRQQERKIYLDE